MNPQAHSALVLVVNGIIGAAMSGAAIVISELLDRRSSRRSEARTMKRLWSKKGNLCFGNSRL